jgi:hypothetical protein
MLSVRSARSLEPASSPALAGASPAPGSRESAAQQVFMEKFGALAEDRAGFHAFMASVFGAGYDREAAEALRQRTLAGDSSWLPPIRFVGADTLGGANGAYDREAGVVYLNRALDPATAAETYVEEVGHHLDTRLNRTDTAGDEGELFRRRLGGERLSAAEEARIRAENDHGTIVVDGREVEVEFWNPISAIGDAVSSVVDAIGSAAKGVAKATEHFFGGLAEGVGGFFDNLFSGRVGDAFGALWRGLDRALLQSARSLLAGGWDAVEGLVHGFTQLFPDSVAGGMRAVTDRVMDAGRSLVTGAFDVVHGAIRDVAEGAGRFVGGVGRFFSGDFGGGLKDMGLGLLQATGQAVADAALLGLGKGVSAIQTLLGLEAPGRRLTAEEISVLRRVYGDSIDYDQVRIKEGGAGLFSLNDRPFAHGNTIYMKGNTIDEGLLVHEMAHVWQFQNGGTDYMSEALFSQQWGHGYDWRASVPGTPFAELEPEQQAELLEKAYSSGYLTGGADRFVYDGVDYTDYIERALADVRAGRGAP